MLNFDCSTRGLAAALNFDQAGIYDGVGGWVLAAGRTQGLGHLSMAELHEALHHELQVSSAWGVVAGFALVLSQRGYRRYTLKEAFLEMVERSRASHEVFATTLSVTDRTGDQARQLLYGNDTYLGYLERGLALVDDTDPELPWQFRSAAITAVVRVCMRPAAALQALRCGFARLRRDSFDMARDSPDARLATYERMGGPRSWSAVFAQLLQQYPDRGGDADPDTHADTDSEAYDRLRRFEEEILLPRCHRHVAGILQQQAMPSVDASSQSVLAHALKAAVADIDPELASWIRLVTHRQPAFEQAPEYGRQSIRLREPLRGDLEQPTQTLTDLHQFRSISPLGRVYACGVWLDHEVAIEQFDLAGRNVPDRLVALSLVPSSATLQQHLRYASAYSSRIPLRKGCNDCWVTHHCWYSQRIEACIDTQTCWLRCRRSSRSSSSWTCR